MIFSMVNEYISHFQSNWTLIYRSYGVDWANNFRAKTVSPANSKKATTTETQAYAEIVTEKV